MTNLGLRGKSLLFLMLACVVALALAGVAGWQAVERARDYFGQAFVRNFTLLSRHQILAPVAQDLVLSQRLAASVVTRDWLLDEHDAAKRERFFREAEGYRRTFRSHAYFLASALSGNYYFQDGDAFALGAPRYTLNRSESADAWFYDTLALHGDYNVNVNFDRALKLTRVWLNVVVRDGGRPLGVMGSSVDLSQLLRDFVAPAEEGVTPMILDRDGQIQIHPDERLIAYNLGAGVRGNSHSIYDMLGDPGDRASLGRAMQAARDRNSEAQTARVNLDGRRQLVGVAYVPQLDWYVLAALDPRVAQVLGTDWLAPIAGMLVVLVLALLAGFGYAVERLVLRPLRRLNDTARQMAEGRYDVALPPAGRDEIGELGRAFGVMADKVRRHTSELEERVHERTLELEIANASMAEVNRKLGESLESASLIQRAMLPDAALRRTLGESQAVLWLPRDVVSGDFYVFRADGDEGNCLLGVMDCAGHGVPAALMTMLAKAAVDVALAEVGPRDPAALLACTDSALRAMLANARTLRRLEMATSVDIGLAYLDRAASTVTYAGAGIALRASDGAEVLEAAGQRRGLAGREPVRHENAVMAWRPGWTYCLATDGLLDQNGGESGFGFGNNRLMALLRQHAGLPAAGQAQAFGHILREYQGSRPQRDDITVLFFRYD